MTHQQQESVQQSRAPNRRSHRNSGIFYGRRSGLPTKNHISNSLISSGLRQPALVRGCNRTEWIEFCA